MTSTFANVISKPSAHWNDGSKKELMFNQLKITVYDENSESRQGELEHGRKQQ